MLLIQLSAAWTRISAVTTKSGWHIVFVHWHHRKSIRKTAIKCHTKRAINSNRPNSANAYVKILSVSLFSLRLTFTITALCQKKKKRINIATPTMPNWKWSKIYFSDSELSTVNVVYCNAYAHTINTSSMLAHLILHPKKIHLIYLPLFFI